METPGADDSLKRPSAPRFWKTDIASVAAIAFWISVVSFMVTSGLELGALGAIVGLAGTAACGFFWLLARALFRHEAGRDVWPWIVVAILVVTGLLLDLTGDMRTGSGFAATTLRMTANVHSLLSSTALLLVFAEIWLSYRNDLPEHEKRFRLGFAGIYGALMVISVVWLRSMPEGSWAEQSGDLIRMFCAGLATALSVWALRFRRAHPLPKPKRRRRVAAISDDEAALGRLVLQHIEQDEVFLEPDLKLADLATRLGQPDHKVRNAITGALGFQNFNNLINHYRIRAATAVLSDNTRQHLPILTVAMDCGFSSIGPFNRAFKLETGQTPSAFRAAQAAQA